MTQLHYLSCLSEHCEKFACVARRDYENKILILESYKLKLEEATGLLTILAREVWKSPCNSGRKCLHCLAHDICTLAEESLK